MSTDYRNLEARTREEQASVFAGRPHMPGATRITGGEVREQVRQSAQRRVRELERAFATLGPEQIAAANPKAAQALRDGKAPLDLIEHAAELEIAKVMHTGALKYGRRNYVHPDTRIYATTYIAAIRRHIGAYAAGETLDPDTDLSHLAHIGANINVVLAAMAAGTFVDDREGEAKAASAVSNQRHSGG